MRRNNDAADSRPQLCMLKYLGGGRGAVEGGGERVGGARPVDVKQFGGNVGRVVDAGLGLVD